MSSKQRYDRSDIRRLNAVSVLDKLRADGPMSRARIAAALGLTRATVSNIATDLLNASLISETSYDEGGAGRPGLLLNLNPNSGSMIAVDIDVDRTSVVLSNLGLEILWRDQMSQSLDSSAEVSLEKVIILIEEALCVAQQRGLECRGICVAWAGLVDRERGELAYGPTSGWEHIPLKLEWECRFGVPVYVENEAHIGAIGAHHFGPRPGARNLVYLSVGVGLAAGVFVDGVLLRGKRGFAGQVGHTHFAYNGIECTCGRSGCWVTEVGASAVRRKLLEAGVEVPRETGGEVDWVSVVLESARAGDCVALGVLESVGRQLGRGLSQLVQMVNPSIVIVGGRLGALMDCVEPVIRESLMEETLPYVADSLEFVVSGSEDDRLRGCLATVFDAVMKNPPIAEG